MTKKYIPINQLNDIRLEINIECVRSKLEKAERSGFTQESKEEILAKSKLLLTQ